MQYGSIVALQKVYSFEKLSRMGILEERGPISEMMTLSIRIHWGSKKSPNISSMGHYLCSTEEGSKYWFNWSCSGIATCITIHCIFVFANVVEMVCKCDLLLTVGIFHSSDRDSQLLACSSHCYLRASCNSFSVVSYQV